MVKKAEIATQIAKGIQDEFGTRIAKHDELTNKYVLIKKELANVKKSIKGKINTNKKMIVSLKKKRDNIRKKLNAENEKKWLDWINIEEEKRVRSQYIRVEEEKSARKATKYDTKDYKKRAKYLREQFVVVQFELEIQEEELKQLRGQYFEIKGEQT
jgi:5-hydroxyisourate hydrolase-like protein (transthyretin family)